MSISPVTTTAVHELKNSTHNLSTYPNCELFRWREYHGALSDRGPFPILALKQNTPNVTRHIFKCDSTFSTYMTFFLSSDRNDFLGQTCPEGNFSFSNTGSPTQRKNGCFGSSIRLNMRTRFPWINRAHDYANITESRKGKIKRTQILESKKKPSKSHLENYKSKQNIIINQQEKKNNFFF